MVPSYSINKSNGERVQYLQTRLFPVCILQEKGD